MVSQNNYLTLSEVNLLQLLLLNQQPKSQNNYLTLSEVNLQKNNFDSCGVYGLKITTSH